MNKAVYFFKKSTPPIYQLIIGVLFVKMSPLSVPPFIPNQLLEAELWMFVKFACGLKKVCLGCEDPELMGTFSPVFTRHVTWK